MSERKLATIERVAALTPIPDADLIVAATIRGWQVVVRKGEFKVGDRVVYFEIDTMLPLQDARFAFLAPRGEKEVDGLRVHVLKSARMRGQYSQGLALPCDAATFPELAATDARSDENPCLSGHLGVGDDVTEILGLRMWEPPIPQDLLGRIAGPFPTDVVCKTASVRVQNIPDDRLQGLAAAGRWEATEKIDGTSTTLFNDPVRGLRIAGRNWELSEPSSPNQQGAEWWLADELNLRTAIPAGWVVQAELFGEGVVGNPLRVAGKRLAIFDVFGPDRRRVVRSNWPPALAALAAPVYTDLPFPTTVAQSLAQVDGIDSLVSPGRKAEGVVWHELSGCAFTVLDGRDGFKAISNKYLIKTGA